MKRLILCVPVVLWACSVNVSKPVEDDGGVPWSGLTGAPKGASCPAGTKTTGIDVAAGTVTCAPDQDGLGALVCADGKVVKRADGGWQCGDDLQSVPGAGITQLVAGAGLLGGTITTSGTLSVDFDTNGTALKVAHSDHTHAALAALRQEFDDTAFCPRLVNKAGTLRVYAKDLTTIPGAVRCTSGTDEMVKVGDFWVDRYELSSCGLSLGTGPGQDTTATGCSVAGVIPQASITWFQAAAMCVNAGKHLCSNAEWQAAAAGTHDPATGSDGAGGTCVTGAGATGPRATGGATAAPTGCRSVFGAEDMIGNLWEWVADWHQAGMTWQTSDGQSATPWPTTPDYNGDGTWNVNGTAHNGSAFKAGLLAAPIRGGSWISDVKAGVFALHLNNGPSAMSNTIGARCCAGGR